MSSLEPIDLHHLGVDRAVGCYLLDTRDGPALLDCGPASTLETLRGGLRERGLEVADLRHLLLTHIHFDHAGAAGALVREQPQLQVHVSPVGAPHMVDPSRLERSARRLYGDAFDTLWGELTPIPEENVHVVEDDVAGLECFPTPGHASHHVTYLDPEGTMYTGDVAGVRIQPARFVLPPTPPPDIDVDAWLASIDEMERRDPQRLALIHFGVADDPRAHLEQLRARLARWAEVIETGVDQDEFTEIIERELDVRDDERDAYARAMPLEQCYLGLARWAEKRRESAA